MPKKQSKVNPDLVRQEIEKGRMGDRALEQKPDAEPDIGFSEEVEAVVWDDDQRQLVENQDMTEIDRARGKRSR